MDAFIETVSQILIDWGYPGLFISALLAGSIVPFSSEIVLLGLVKLGLDLLSASFPLRWEHSRRDDVLLHGAPGQSRLD